MHLVITHWTSQFESYASSNLDFVVDAYYHAITARFPRARYYCGWDAILLHIPFSFFPTRIADILFNLVVARTAPVPAAVLARKAKSY